MTKTRRLGTGAAEQQAGVIVSSARELLVRQRTQLVNAVRGHATEFVVVAAKDNGDQHRMHLRQRTRPHPTLQSTA